MKKKLLTLILTTFVSFNFIGCGNKNESFSTEKNTCSNSLSCTETTCPNFKSEDENICSQSSENKENYKNEDATESTENSNLKTSKEVASITDSSRDNSIKANTKSLKEPSVKTTTENIGVPVLCYHAVGDVPSNELYIPEEKLKEQLVYLKDNGYTALSMDELYGYLVQNEQIPEKSVVITFDDGYESAYTLAYPILQELNMKATIYMISSFVGRETYLTEEQLQKMNHEGLVEIQSHTVDHPVLRELSYENQLLSIKKSKEDLERILNRDVEYLAYPYSKFNEDSKAALKESGYKLAFNLYDGIADKEDHPYDIDRIYISGYETLESFINLLTKTSKDPINRY